MADGSRDRALRRPGGRAISRIWSEAILDPRRIVRGISEVPRFLRDWRRYARMPSAERLSWHDANPQLFDRTADTGFDPHYFHVGAWAARRIFAARPSLHVDVGSHHVFVGTLAAGVPVVFVDYRPLRATVSGLTSIQGSLLALPFADASVISLSCLHVAEHVGLGRYGDPLDPLGTRKAAAELARVLAPGGDLYFALPVGRPRVCFNAHRVHSAQGVRGYFGTLDLAEFAGTSDDGALVESPPLGFFDDAEYACGFFRFRRPR
jgi:hypothetical protein